MNGSIVAFLVPVYCMLIFGVPLVVATTPILLTSEISMKILMVFLAPVLFAISFVGIAATLSKAGKKAIIRGTFQRNLHDPVYGPRRLYALCWTSIFYFSPLYFAMLSVPSMRNFLFRAFGYSGSTDITVYPDVWIRDLPLLNFAPKAYLANKSTIGSNICLMDGRILVEGITLGENALIGHMALVAPGVRMEPNTELAVHAAIGIRSRLQVGAKVQPNCTLHHGVDIGKNSEIGICSFLGLRAKIGDQIKVPAGANIPSGANILTQEEVNQYISSENQMLQKIRMAAMEEFHHTPPTTGSPLSLVKARTADEAA